MEESEKAGRKGTESVSYTHLDVYKRQGMDRLPDTKENQNHHIGTVFLDAFPEEKKSEILNILENGKYIPQEILNEHDWG